MKKLDLRNTDFRVIVGPKLITEIKRKSKEKGGPYLLHKSTQATPTIYYRLLNGGGIHNKYFYQILDFLEIDKKDAEKEIIGLTYNGGKFVYTYLPQLDPLLFRIICHIIGDGSVASKHTCRWIQHKDNSHWLNELIKEKLGFSPTVSKAGSESCDAVTISAYFHRLLKYYLNISVKDIKNYESIKKFHKLPNEYKLQFLFAFIVDEGHIRYGNARSLIISQKEKGVIEEIAIILDSFDFDHSIIRKEVSKKGDIVYRLNIYAEGVEKMYKEIIESMKKYGKYAGLWQKQTLLEEYIHTLKRPKGF